MVVAADVDVEADLVELIQVEVDNVHDGFRHSAIMVADLEQDEAEDILDG